MGSGFCLCAGADFLSARVVGGGVPDARGAVKTAPYNAKDKGVGNGKAAGRACPAPTEWRQYKRPGRDELFPYGSR